MRSSPELEQKLLELSKEGHIEPRFENNQYLKVSYKGSGDLITPKWNIKSYKTGSIVCNDMGLLDKLINDEIKPPDSSLQLIQIDDAGVGFPLLGVMIGITDGKRVVTGTINVSWFKPGPFERKDYLEAYAIEGLRILKEAFKTTPETHRIEICTGFINTRLKKKLEDLGYDTRIIEIKGLLQDSLERLFKEYIQQELGADLGYDPKELNDSEIGRSYFNTVNWGKKHVPHLLKTGWKTLQV